MKLLISTWVYSVLVCVVLSAGYARYWDRSYRNYRQYYRQLYGRRNSSPLAGSRVLSSMRQMPLGIYSNYLCNLLGSKLGKRSVADTSSSDTRETRIVRNPSLRIPRYMMTGHLLRRYADFRLGKTNVDKLEYTLRVFFNVSVQPYLYSVIAKREEGHSYGRIRHDLLRALLSKYKGMKSPLAVDYAVRAINIVDQAGPAQFQQYAGDYGASNCKSLSFHGRVYLCSQLDTAMGMTKLCGVANAVTMLYDDCKCQSTETIYVPIPNPHKPPSHPNPAPVAPTSAPATSAPQVTAAPGATTAAPVIANDPDCGVSSINPARDFHLIRAIIRQWRIVGGVNAQNGEFPWAVVVNSGNALCAGSIINSTHILTAAHCSIGTRPEHITVDVGEHDRLNDNDHTSFKVSKVVIHENYQPGEEINDIALLQLASPIDFNAIPDAGTICLPTGSFANTVSDATECIVAGWGTIEYQGSIANTLQEVSVPTFSGTSCTTNFDTVPSSPSTQLCAGAPNTGGVDSCQGDSGAPLFCAVKGRWVQYGLVSYGDGCANPGQAGVYTAVSQYTDWITGV